MGRVSVSSLRVRRACLMRVCAPSAYVRVSTWPAGGSGWFCLPVWVVHPSSGLTVCLAWSIVLSMQTTATQQHTVRDLHAHVAKDLRPKNTAVNPRYQVIDRDGVIVDELTSKRAAVETARMLDGRS